MKYIPHSVLLRNLLPVGPIPVPHQRIAVCLFGATRNVSKYTLKSIKQNVFSQVARHDPQFRRLAHFNNPAIAPNETRGRLVVAVDPDECRHLNCDVAMQTDLEEIDKRMDFDSFKQIGDVGNDDFAALKDDLRHFYSLNAVTELLLREKTRFDLVIFSRADLWFNRPLRIPEIRPRTVYTAWFDRYLGMNERFAMGDFETMIAYGQRQASVRTCCENRHRPSDLLWYAKKQGLQVRHLRSIDFSPMRSNEGVSVVDCSRKTKFGHYFRRGLEVLKLRRR